MRTTARRWRAVASALLLAASARPSEAQPFVEQRFNGPVVPINYVDAGKGPPIVLLHGDSQNWRVWEQNGMLADLARDYRVIAIDLRGRGKSGKPHDPAAYDQQLPEDVIALLDHLRIKRAHVLGYSYGAHVTVELLTRHADRVITAILGGAAGRISVTDALLQQYELEARERDTDCRSRSQVNRLSPPGSPPLSDSLFQVMRAACFADPLMDSKALAASSRGSSRHPITEAQVRAITTVPLLGVVGTEDPFLPDFQKFVRWNPALVLVTIEGGTHGSVQLQSAPLLAAVRTWLGVYRQKP
ncbi:MAG: alpha/beta hydrolase [Gemmatimonadaceae bacterium]|nr:alpha/beta hydrolase [Gemmatimonadaceae bacterium]